MAGLFGLFDYSKEGKGVRKDEPEKTGVALFFGLFKRKFRNYIKLSIMYAITCIPTFIYFLLVGMYVLQDIATTSERSLAIILLSSIVSMAAVLFFSGSVFRPGFDYILRNYTRSEHAWIISDFFKHTKNNFKQSVCVYLIDLAFLTLALINFRFYIVLLNTSNNIFPIVMITLFVIVVYIYSVMQTYIGTMMVTFRLKLREIYKNAFIFTVLGIKNNFISFAVRAIIFGIVFYYLNLPVALILYAVVLFGATGLMSEIGVYPIIKKYMLDKLDSASDENIEDANFYGDNNEIIPIDDEPENMNINGPDDIANLFKNKNDVLEEPKNDDEKN